MRPVVIYTYTSKSTLNLKPAVDTFMEWCIDNNHEPIIVKGIDVRTRYLLRQIRYLDELEDRPHLICYFGHGLDDRLLGLAEHKLLKNFDPLVLLRSGREGDMPVYAGNVIFTWACNSLSILGKWAVNSANAIAYTGNYTPIRFSRFDSDGDYIEDYTDLALSIPMDLINGRSIQESINGLKTKISRYMKIYQDHDDTMSVKIAMSLEDLYNNYDFVGDGNFRFEEE